MREVKITLREVNGKWQVIAIDRYHSINTKPCLNPMRVIKKVLKLLNVKRINKAKDVEKLDESLKPIK